MYLQYEHCSEHGDGDDDLRAKGSVCVIRQSHTPKTFARREGLFFLSALGEMVHPTLSRGAVYWRPHNPTNRRNE